MVLSLHPCPTSELESLKKEIDQIKSRNQKVETDKAWETSLKRKLLLIVFTYLAIGFYLQAVGVNRPWLNAIVPAVAFFLSTLTLPYLRKLWEKYIYKK